jgi:hypothetical protein
MEADALRRELNEWRDRAALPRVEEPIRGEGFAMVLAGELEVISAVQEEDEDNDDYADDDFPTSSLAPPPAQEQQPHFPALAAAKAAAAAASVHPFAPNGSSPASLPPLNMAAGPGMGPRSVPHASSGPMIASSPTTINFENPVMPALYEPSHATGPFAPFISQAQAMPDVDKVAAWNAHMFSAQQAQLAAQRSLLTPPGSSHGMPNAAAGFPDASQAFFANFQRHQAQMAGAYADMEDVAAAAAAAAVREHRAHIGRERRGSGSGYGSPSEASSYEMPSAISDYAAGRRGLHVGTNFDPLAMGMMKQGLASPTASGRVGGGGGGNAHGYMMMM